MKEQTYHSVIFVCVQCGGGINQGLCSYDCKYDGLAANDRPANTVMYKEYETISILIEQRFARDTDFIV